MDDGWKMKDIDEMDFFGFLHVRAYNAAHKKEQSNQEDKPAPAKEVSIDEAFPGLI